MRRSNVEPAMRQFMTEQNIGAGVLGVMWKGEIIYNKPFGWMDKSHTIGIRHDVMMRVASLTKPITAAAIRKLEACGVLTLDQRVFDVGQPGGGILQLEPWPSVGDPRIADITVGHLLRHRGGFPTNEDIARDPSFQSIEIANRMKVKSPPGREMMMRYALGQKLDCIPGERDAYSNIGYLALGLVIERASRMEYLKYIQDHVFATLRISPDDVIQGRTRTDDRSDRDHGTTLVGSRQPATCSTRTDRRFAGRTVDGT